MSNWRRYEILLPLQFNDGGEIPGEWIAEADRILALTISPRPC